MPYEIDRKRLNHMSAYIKYYDDGSEILQSYSTNVVKKTPDGKYIRLWHSWSSSTSKQVKTWCGHSFRQLPYEDGTYEDLTKEYKRIGRTLGGRIVKQNVNYCKQEAKEFIKSIEQGLLYAGKNGDRYDYTTLIDKEVRQHYKNNKKMIELLNVLRACANKKLIRGNNPMNVFLKLYNFDFDEIWENSGLHEKHFLTSTPAELI